MCCIRCRRKKGSRIGTRKAKHEIRIYELRAASKDSYSKHCKEDRIRTRKIKFDTNYFPIGVHIHSSRCMTNNGEYFKIYVPNNRNNEDRIKVADRGSIKVKGRGTVKWKLKIMME